MLIKKLLPSYIVSPALTLDKWLKALSLVVVMLLLATFLLGIFVPLYTDEVATKIVQARFFAEGGKIVTLFPQCGASFVVDTPLTWYPAAIIYAFLYAGLEPLGLRISGVAMALAWIALSFWGIVRITSIRQYSIYLYAAVAVILGLGVLPFLMILARSEQWLILLITLYCLFPIISRRVIFHKSTFSKWGLFFVFCLVTSLFFYSHPKAIFFFPLVIISAFYTFGIKNRLLLWLSISFLAICAFQSVLFAKTLTHCEGAPKLSAMLTSQTLDFGLIKTAPLEFIATATENIINAPNSITNYVLFSNNYQSGWLPAVNEASLTFAIRFVNSSSKTLLLTCLWSALLLPLFFFSKLRSTAKNREKFFLALALWIGLVGHLAIFSTWNFYGGALVLPLSLLILVLLGADTFQLAMQRLWAKWVLLIVLVISLSSFYVLFYTILPNLILNSHSDKGLLVGQPLSVSAFNFSTQRLRVRALAKTCGINGDDSTHLVIDDLTYFAFERLHQPVHVIYLYGGGFGLDVAGDRVQPFLTKIASDGIIARCTYLPEFYKDKAVRDGNYCCVNISTNK